MTDLVRCRLVGRIQRPDFVTRHIVKSLGFGDRVIVPQERLTHPLNAHMQVPRADIEHYAQLRMANDRARGIRDGRLPGTLKPKHCGRVGVAGELAAGRFYGVQLQHDGPDPGYDFVWGNGETCDVKGTQHRHGVLYFDKLDDFKADWALLVVVEATLDAFD